MRQLFAITAARIVRLGTTLAQAIRSARNRDRDRETNGALPADPRSLYEPGERSVRADPDRPDASWQDEAYENSEQPMRDRLDCGVDRCQSRGLIHGWKLPLGRR